MKKILLGLLLTIGINANPYVGLGGTLTDKQEDCRAYVVALAGYQVNDRFGGEIRYSRIARGDYQWISIYSKMELLDNVYGLVGWEKSLTDDDYAGLNFGVGYTMSKTSFEIVYRKEAKAPAFNVLFRF